jgi:hypothetical protein
MNHVVRITVLASLMMSPFFVTAQCTPLSSYTNDPAGFYPDSLTFLAQEGFQGQPFSAQIDFKSYAIYTDMTPGVPITVWVDSIQLLGITGLPAGFTWQAEGFTVDSDGNYFLVNSFENNDCNSLESSLACFSIMADGTATESPDYLFGAMIPVSIQMSTRVMCSQFPGTPPGSYWPLTNNQYVIRIRGICEDYQWPNLTASVVNTTCPDVSDGSIEIVPATTGFTYSLDGDLFQESNVFEGLTAGSYTVNVRSAEGCTTSVAAVINNQDYPWPDLTASVVNTTCPWGSDGSIEILSATAGFTYSIDGSLFQESNVFGGMTAGSYTVNIRSAEGCTTSVAAAITSPNLFEILTPICLVTVDSTSQYNIVVWEKPETAPIDSFYVYREVTQGVFERIGGTSYSDAGRFDDFDANPNVTRYRYVLSVVDVCGNDYDVPLLLQNDFLAPHSTIHLQHLGNGNLSWSHYMIGGQNPVQFYRVYRDNFGNGNFQPISTTVPGGNNSFTDVNFSSYPNASYVVDVAWALSCDPNRVLTTTRSNRFTGQLPVGVSGGGATDLHALPQPRLRQAHHSPARERAPHRAGAAQHAGAGHAPQPRGSGPQ